LELEQIVLVDKTGPSIPVGVSPGAACLVAEFLKGPFNPREVVSTADIITTYAGISALLSQSAAGLQDGSGIRFEGNGALALLGKQFLKLVLERVDQDMTSLDAGTVKVFVKFSVLIDASDIDPLAAGFTGKDIVVPAGTRFADAPLATATYVIALSQDVLIPKGTAIVATKVAVLITLTQNPDGLFTQVASGGTSGATAFFVKGTGALISTLDTVIDTAIPNVLSTVSTTPGDTDIVTASAVATAAFAAGTAAVSLALKNDSLYSAAIDKTQPSDAPMEDITVIWAARRGEIAATIRTPIVNNAISASNGGRGRIGIVAGPRVGTAPGDAASASAAKTEVLSTTGTESPGREDRKIIGFPYVKIFSLDLNRLVTISPDGFMASTISQFPEEKNPGAANRFIQSIQQYEDAFQTSPLVRQDYINFKAKGVAALRKDRSVGWWFQSGVTSVDPAVTPTRAPIKRRRMADFIQDTLSGLGAKYDKEPATQDRVDQLAGECEAFLSTLKSPPNPANKRIEDFIVDTKSGNTPQLVALGIFTIIVKVRLLASLDTLVFETTIGETVEIPTA
jgi:hypothetical protein